MVETAPVVGVLAVVVLVESGVDADGSSPGAGGDGVQVLIAGPRHFRGWCSRSCCSSINQPVVRWWWFRWWWRFSTKSLWSGGGNATIQILRISKPNGQYNFWIGVGYLGGGRSAESNGVGHGAGG